MAFHWLYKARGFLTTSPSPSHAWNQINISSSTTQAMPGDDDSIANSPSIGRKFRRPAQSCERCRRRKVRCDLGTPCTACQISRVPLDCTYRDDPAENSHRSGANVGDVREPENIRNDTPDRTAKRPRLTTEGEGRIHELETRLHQLEHHSASRNSLVAGSGNGGGSGSAAAGQTSTIPAALPRLRHTQDKVKIFPSSHWLHTAEKV